ncbi:phenylacetic acid degradation-like protein [Mycobacterium tuberculosis]|nr:phenylacetic acid degradation-like protein [Mycobacterium tuberculosis]
MTFPEARISKAYGAGWRGHYAGPVDDTADGTLEGTVDGMPGDAAGGAAEVARRCAETMYAQDKVAQDLAMEIAEVAPGRARLRMTVAGTMVNGFGIAHGGYLFLLADSAFAYACNTMTR